MNIEISIITINYNGLADTCAFIDSIPSNDDSLEVIVVDNASKEDEATIIKQRFPHVKVIRSTQNLGFAGGNNLGIKAANGNFLLFLNNDTILKGTESEKQKALQALKCRLASSPNIGMVSSKIRFAWGNFLIQYAGYTPLSRITIRNRAIGCGEEDHGQYDSPHPTPYAHGAAMMVKREVIEQAGLMPECYFLYYEELDWSMMIRRAGYEIWYEPACTIYHKESQATGQNSPTKTYYITRNRLLFIKRNSLGLSKYISYLYIIGIVAFKDMLKHLLHGRTDLAHATYKGIIHFLKM